MYVYINLYILYVFIYYQYLKYYIQKRFWKHIYLLNIFRFFTEALSVYQHIYIIHIYIYMYIYMYIHMHIYMYIYVYIYIHTYIHTYIHILIHWSFRLLFIGLLLVYTSIIPSQTRTNLFSKSMWGKKSGVDCLFHSSLTFLNNV